MGRVIDAVIRLTDNFTSPMSKTIQAMTEASRKGREMRRSIEEAGRSISAVGTSLTKTVTLPVAGVATACGKMAMDFENGIAKVSTIADTSVMSLDRIKSATIDLSNQLGVSVAEISEAQYNAISAGAKTQQSLEVVGTAVKAAKAGFTDTATAVDGLTTVYNSFQGSVDYQVIADQMLLTQNYGKTTFGEMASSIGMVTPIANALNVSTEELFSSIAILTKNGINTSSAITGMKAAYSNILKPTAEASKTAKQLGIDFSASHLQAVGWADFLGEIREKTAGNTDAMAKLFGSVEALNSMTVLAGAGMDDFNSCLEQMEKSAGLTEQSYKKLLTPSERWNIALNKIKNDGITVGEKLIPVFERVTGAVDAAAERFNGLSESQINMIMKIAATATAAGPLINIFGKMVSGSTKVLGIIAKVNQAGGAVKFMLAALTSPAGIVIGILAAMAVAAVVLFKNFDTFKESLKKFSPLFSEVRNRFQKLMEQIEPLIKSAKQAGVIFKQVFQDMIIKAATAAVAAGGKIAKAVLPVITGIISAIRTIDFPKIINNIGKVGEHFQQTAQKIWPIAEKIGEVVTTVFQIKFAAVFGAAIGFFGGFATQIGTIIDGIMTVFEGLVMFISGVFLGDWGLAWEGVKTVFSGIFESIVGIAKGVINGVAGAVNGVVRAINGMGITIPDWVPGIGGKAFQLNLPEIPMLARGTDSWKGGIVQVHEKGGEIIDLPRGSRVYPHDESIRKAREENKGGFVLEKLADKIIVREEADIYKIAQALLRELRKAGMNMGEVY